MRLAAVSLRRRPLMESLLGLDSPDKILRFRRDLAIAVLGGITTAILLPVVLNFIQRRPLMQLLRKQQRKRKIRR